MRLNGKQILHKKSYNVPNGFRFAKSDLKMKSLSWQNDLDNAALTFFSLVLCDWF